MPRPWEDKSRLMGGTLYVPPNVFSALKATSIMKHTNMKTRKTVLPQPVWVEAKKKQRLWMICGSIITMINPGNTFLLCYEIRHLRMYQEVPSKVAYYEPLPYDQHWSEVETGKRPRGYWGMKVEWESNVMVLEGPVRKIFNRETTLGIQQNLF